MTVRASGKPARRRTLSARVAAGFVVMLLGGSLALASPAVGATPEPTPEPTPTPEIPIGTTAFTLSPVGSGVVSPGDGLTVSITLQNATGRATEPVEVTLELGTNAISDRGVLSDWLDETDDSLATEPVATTTFESVDRLSEASEGMLVEADDPALSDLEAGVYPLVASYDSAEGEVRSTSVMIISDAGTTTASIGVVVPITAPSLTQGLLTSQELADLTAPGGSLANQLKAVESTPAILAVDPAIAAAIRVLGSAAPATATEWLDDLLALPNSRFALQFGDADVTTQLEAGLAKPLQPRALTAYMSEADFEVSPGADPTPSSTPAADADEAVALPDTASLLDIGGAVSGVYWPAPDSLNSDVLTTLGNITIDDQKALTVMSSNETGAGAAGATVGARARVDDAAALVYDSDISDSLHAASLQGNSALRAADLTAATAHLTLAAKGSRGAPLMVTVGRDEDRSNVALRTAITSAYETPGFDAADLTELADSSARRAQVVDAEADAARTARTTHLIEDEAEVTRFATVLDDTTLLTGPERAEMLQLMSVSWASSDTWDDAVAEHRVQTQATLDSVGLLPSSTINLLGSGAGLGFWVRNDLPYPVNLVLYTSPDDLRLDVQRATPVMATAASNTRVEVPVEARVANGEVTLALQLRSRTSVAIGDAEYVQVNVRAEWEAFGVGALAVVVGGLLIAGVIRTVQRARSKTSKGDAVSTEVPEPTDASGKEDDE